MQSLTDYMMNIEPEASEQNESYDINALENNMSAV